MFLLKTNLIPKLKYYVYRMESKMNHKTEFDLFLPCVNAENNNKMYVQTKRILFVENIDSEKEKFAIRLDTGVTLVAFISNAEIYLLA